MQRPSKNFVYTLAETAKATIAEGYYERAREAAVPNRSLLSSLRTVPHTPIITEVKFRSPAEGALRSAEDDPREIAMSYERGGACGISVLTEPRHFRGDLSFLTRVKDSVGLPVLMKDIVVDPIQVEAARRVGADALLLMVSVFQTGLARLSLDEAIELAHSKGLEVLLEAHTEEEYRLALNSGADIVGINNRNLETLEVTLETTRDLLRLGKGSKTVISESGISRREEVVELGTMGADGFLIGSTLMRSKNIEETLRTLAGVHQT